MRKRNLGLLAAGTTLVGVLLAATVAWAAGDHRNVQMLDACDPATFNAAIGEEDASEGSPASSSTTSSRS